MSRVGFMSQILRIYKLGFTNWISFASKSHNTTTTTHNTHTYVTANTTWKTLILRQVSFTICKCFVMFEVAVKLLIFYNHNCARSIIVVTSP